MRVGSHLGVGVLGLLDTLRRVSPSAVTFPAALRHAREKCVPVAFIHQPLLSKVITVDVQGRLPKHHIQVHTDSFVGIRL